MGKRKFLFFSDHVTLIFNISLKFYFSLFKTQFFTYKSYFIKTLFAIFNKFTILFAFKIEKLQYIKILKETFKVYFWQLNTLFYTKNCNKLFYLF